MKYGDSGRRDGRELEAARIPATTDLLMTTANQERPSVSRSWRRHMMVVSRRVGRRGCLASQAPAGSIGTSGWLALSLVFHITPALHVTTLPLDIPLTTASRNFTMADDNSREDEQVEEEEEIDETVRHIRWNAWIESKCSRMYRATKQ